MSYMDPNSAAEGTTQRPLVSRAYAASLVETERGGTAVALGEPTANSPGGNELEKLHRLMRGRYRWAALLAVVLGATGAWFGFKAGKKSYVSTAQIQLIPVIPRLYEGDEKGVQPMFEQYVNAEAARIRSQSILNSALDSAGWQEVRQGTSDNFLKDFSEGLAISVQSNLIQVRVRDTDPKAAVAAVSAVLAAYERDHKTRSKLNGEEKRALLDAQQAKLNSKLAGLRQSILRAANGQGPVENYKDEYEFTLTEKRQLEVEIRRVQIALAAQKATSPAAQNGQRAEAATADEIAHQDPRMRELLATKASFQQAVRSLEAKGVLPKHPFMVEAARLLKSAEGDIREHLESYLKNGPVASPPVAETADGGLSMPGLENSVAGASPRNLRFRLAALNQLYEMAKTDFETAKTNVTAQRADEQKQAQELERLRAEADLCAQDLTRTQKEIEGLELESKMTGRLEIGRVERPLGPDKDTRVTFAAAGGFGGVFTAFGLVLLVGLLDRRLRFAADAQSDVFGARMLGILPTLPTGTAPPAETAIAAHCIHNIRTQLQIRRVSKSHRVFAITGSAAGTGKTSLTFALGLSFASAGHRTLLIDCDLVGGALSRRAETIVRRKLGKILLATKVINDEQRIEALGVARAVGRRLGDVLVERGMATAEDIAAALVMQSEQPVGLLEVLGGERLEDSIAETAAPDLYVLSLGGASGRHVSRLSPEALHQLLTQAREQFDTVVVDTGPIPGSLEASIVASQVDGVIVTVSRGEQRAAAESCVSYLNDIGARVAGIVFNRATRRDVEMQMFSSSGSSGSRVSGDRSLAVGADRLRDVDHLNEESTVSFGPVARVVSARSSTAKAAGSR